MTSTMIPPVVTVTISGEIDICTSGAMRDVIAAALGDGTVHVEADLSGVIFMDASGIRVLVAARCQAAEAGGSLTLRAPSEAVRRITGLLGLDEVLLTRLEE